MVDSKFQLRAHRSSSTSFSKREVTLKARQVPLRAPRTKAGDDRKRKGRLIRLTAAIVATLCASTAVTSATRADTAYLSDYRYLDGTTAHAETVCATADLCGTISLRGGDVISVYAETASGCELPTLHIVARRGGALLLSYQMTLSALEGHRQASPSERPTSYGCRTKGARVNFDKGRVRMAVFPLATGNQLFVRFAAGLSQEHTNSTPAIIRAN